MNDRRFQRMTPQRKVILEELKKLEIHPTADELYAVVRRRLPRISLGTVYRNLELLSNMGLARKLKTSGRKFRFDGDVDQHCHIHCVRCGRVDDFPHLETGLESARFESTNGWNIIDHHLEVLGFCPECRGKQ